MAVDLRFLSLSVDTDRLDESRRRVPLDVPVAVLRVATEKGAVRAVQINRAQLLDLMESAVIALRRGVQ